MSTADTLPMTIPARSPDRAIRPLSDVVDVVQHLGQLWDLANILVQSRMIPGTVGSTEAAVAIILKGRELGIGPMHAFDSISVIQGKPTISPQLMLALIERSGFSEDMIAEEEPEACHITMKRRGRSAQRVTFDRKEATSMGLWGKGNWLKMPGVMLYWRCVAKAARRVYPDVIAGCYTPEEMGADVNEEGEIIEAEVVAARPRKFPDQGSGHGTSGSYAKPAAVKAARAKIAEVGKDCSARWVAAWVASANRNLPPDLSEYPFKSADVSRSLLLAAIRQGKLEPVEMTTDPETGEPVPRASIDQVFGMIAVAFEREPEWFEQTLRGVIWREMSRVAVAYCLDHPSWVVPDAYEPEEDGEVYPAEEANQDAPEVIPPPAPRKMGKRELAESVRARLEAEKVAATTQMSDDAPWQEGRE